jgi:hypothetical protein
MSYIVASGAWGIGMQFDHEGEVDRNFEAFQKVVGSLMAAYAGQYALLRRGRVELLCKTAGAALIKGYEKFADGLFSVQEVVEQPLDLGFYSHAASTRQDR